MEEKKMNVLDQMLFAMFKPRRYKELTKLKTMNIVLYVAILVVLLSVVKYAIPTGAYIASRGGITHILDTVVPDFSLENGKLDVKETVEKEFSGSIIVVDTSVESFDEKSTEEYLKDYTQCMLISKTNMVVNSGIYSESKFSDLGNVNFDKDMLLQSVPMMYVYLFAAFIVCIVYTLFQFMVMGLLFSLFAMSFNAITDVRLSYGKILKLTLYSLTLPQIIMAITSVFGGYVANMIALLIAMVLCMIIINIGILSHKLPDEANDSNA